MKSKRSLGQVLMRSACCCSPIRLTLSSFACRKVMKTALDMSSVLEGSANCWGKRDRGETTRWWERGGSTCGIARIMKR
eukprot:3729224-Rhodomonas_salina.1